VTKRARKWGIKLYTFESIKSFFNEKAVELADFKPEYTEKNEGGFRLPLTPLGHVPNLLVTYKSIKYTRMRFS
jgi:hypothetical protein